MRPALLPLALRVENRGHVQVPDSAPAELGLDQAVQDGCQAHPFRHADTVARSAQCRYPDHPHRFVAIPPKTPEPNKWPCEAPVISQKRRRGFVLQMLHFWVASG
jgi:hypothetical protein